MNTYEERNQGGTQQGDSSTVKAVLTVPGLQDFVIVLEK